MSSGGPRLPGFEENACTFEGCRGPTRDDLSVPDRAPAGSAGVLPDLRPPLRPGGDGCRAATSAARARAPLDLVGEPPGRAVRVRGRAGAHAFVRPRCPDRGLAAATPAVQRSAA